MILLLDALPLWTSPSTVIFMTPTSTLGVISSVLSCPCPQAIDRDLYDPQCILQVEPDHIWNSKFSSSSPKTRSIRSIIALVKVGDQQTLRLQSPGFGQPNRLIRSSLARASKGSLHSNIPFSFPELPIPTKLVRLQTITSFHFSVGRCGEFKFSLQTDNFRPLHQQRLSSLNSKCV